MSARHRTVRRQRGWAPRRALLPAIATLGMTGVIAGAAIAAVRPPDDPHGASVHITSASVAPGGAVAFTAAGFVADGGGGQVVTVKIDDKGVAGSFTADGAGDVSGSVTAPASTGAHWLRLLAGSGGPGGEGSGGQPPSRSLTADFTVIAAGAAPPGGGGDPGPGTPTTPAPTGPATTGPATTARPPTPSMTLRSRTLTARNARLRVLLRCGKAAACRGTVSVRTMQRVRIGHRHQIVTFAKGAYSLKAGAGKTLTLKLRRDGRILLRAHQRVHVRVAIALRGAKTLSKTLILHRGG